MARTPAASTSRRAKSEDQDADMQSGSEYSESETARKQDKGKGRASEQSNGRSGGKKARTAKKDGDEDDDDDELPGGDSRDADGAEDGNDDQSGIPPEQDIQRKREIRKEYRDMDSKMADEQADNLSAETLTSRLENANRLFSRVEGPAEAVLDSGYLANIASLTLQKARKMKVGGDYFDTEDFILKLKSTLTGGLPIRANVNASPRRQTQGSQRAARSDDEDGEGYADTVRDPYIGWDKIGKLATKHTFKVPPIDFMLGPLAIPQKKKAQRTQKVRQKAKVAEKVRPQEIGEDDVQHDENAAPRLVKLVSDILEEQGGQEGINLFKFLMNPESYTQTVENIFYTSFLVKERRAAIDFDDDGEPIIYACLPPDEEQRQEGDLKPRQLILEMDMQMWEDAVRVYDITNTVIPTRSYQTVQSGKWYG